jgi:DNA-binding XRE family transcriptional regulator
MSASKPLLTLDPPKLSRAEQTEIARAERKRLERVSRIVLRAVRRDAHVSQTELARRLSWTRNMIANLESGRREIGFVDFIMIAKALRMDAYLTFDRILRW